MGNTIHSLTSIEDIMKPRSASCAEKTPDQPSEPEAKGFVYYERGFHLHPDGTLEGASSENTSETKTPAKELKRNRLSRLFEDNSFQHTLVLAGAGTSAAIKGKTRKGLWESCKTEINAVLAADTSRSFRGTEDEDIEQFLSFAVQVANIDANNERLASAISALKAKIRTECDLFFSSDSQSVCHETLLRKLTARKPTLPRVEIFTTNYDTLFEQAAKTAGLITIDGFSFSVPRIFSGSFFDLDIVNRERTRIKGEESFIPNVFHLMKLHGSVDWVSKKEGEIEQRKPQKGEESLIVYPSSEKYAVSYERPFFEMMSRFQTALRKDNVLLIVLGFGFADKHINRAIIEAVRQNPGFHLLIADYGSDSQVIDLGKYQTLFGNIGDNISIVYASFEEFVEALPLNKLYSIPRADFISLKQQGVDHDQSI